MRVLITGGAGFVGQTLAAHLLELESLNIGGQQTGEPVTELICFDRIEGRLQDDRLRYVIGDIGDPQSLAQLVDNKTPLIFHLAAVVSGSAEADFDLGMSANLRGIQGLLECARACGHCPQIVFSSSIAVFGGDLPPVVTDETTPMPQGSYGVQKLIGEQLIQDYSRKGFIRGCSLRLPAVLVRPGLANGAASGFSSAIIREPLAGQSMVLPVPASTEMWASGPGAVASNLVFAAGLEQRAWGFNRSLNLPGSIVTMQTALQMLETLGGPELRAKVSLDEDPAIMALVRTWAARFETPRALALGFEADAGFDEMVRTYIRHHPDAIKVRLRAADQAD